MVCLPNEELKPALQRLEGRLDRSFLSSIPEKIMRKSFLLFTCLLILAVASGCNLPLASTPTPTLPPLPTVVILPTEIPLPTTIPVTQPTAEATAAPTQAPTSQPNPLLLIQAQVAFDNYLLRTGPGRLFDHVAMYDQGESVQIVARETGNNWVLVITADNRGGWMNIAGLQYEGDIATLPAIVVTNAQILRGHVWNVDKTPADLIGVGLQPLTNTDPNLQEQVNTGPDGAWYAYLPINSKGQWVVGPNAYGCPKDVPTGQCSLVGTFPPAQTVTLPVSPDVWIEFLMVINCGC
jgi:hypothetical protein